MVNGVIGLRRHIIHHILDRIIDCGFGAFYLVTPSRNKGSASRII